MKGCIFILCMLVLPFRGFAQCDRFLKQQCLPQLGSFTDMGKRNLAVLLPGDTAQIAVTFYKLHQYRVVVCAEASLGKVSFRILSRKGAVLFDSKTHNCPSYWDFNVEVTQNVVIQLIVPTVAPNQVAQTGCVSLLLGFKGSGK